MPSAPPSPRNLFWKTVATAAAIVGIAATGLMLIRSKNPGSESGAPHAYEPVEIRVGSQLPDFILKKYGAGQTRASELGAKVTLINFWATWCEPCVTELPSIVQLRNKFKNKGFDVVAIDVDEEPDKVLPKAIERYGLNFPVYLDPDQKLADLFDVQGIPLTVIVDAARKILFVERGGRDWNNNESHSMVDRWLSG